MNFTLDQRAWARQHDWCWDDTCSTITVRDTWIDDDNAVQTQRIEINTMSELLEWAGY